MTGQGLGHRVHDDVGAELERTLHQRRRERAVDHRAGAGGPGRGGAAPPGRPSRSGGLVGDSQPHQVGAVDGGDDGVGVGDVDPHQPQASGATAAPRPARGWCCTRRPATTSVPPSGTRSRAALTAAMPDANSVAPCGAPSRTPRACSSARHVASSTRPYSGRPGGVVRTRRRSTTAAAAATRGRRARAADVRCTTASVSGRARCRRGRAVVSAPPWQRSDAAVGSVTDEPGTHEPGTHEPGRGRADRPDPGGRGLRRPLQRARDQLRHRGRRDGGDRPRALRRGARRHHHRRAVGAGRRRPRAVGDHRRRAAERRRAGCGRRVARAVPGAARARARDPAAGRGAARARGRSTSSCRCCTGRTARTAPCRGCSS